MKRTSLDIVAPDSGENAPSIPRIEGKNNGKTNGKNNGRSKGVDGRLWT